MKRTILIFASAFALHLAASPTFVVPEMTLRRGLTDAQYQTLWAMGKNPSVDPATMRDWCFKNYRYQNVTNWLDIVGQSNDFARLSFALQQENFDLDATNDVITAERDAAIAESVRWEGAYDYATNSLAYTSNLLAVTSGQLTAANAKIQSEITFLDQMAVMCDQLIIKYPAQREEIEAIKALFVERKRVLQTVTSNND